MNIENELKKFKEENKPKYALKRYEKEIKEMSDLGYSKTQIVAFLKSIGVKTTRRSVLEILVRFTGATSENKNTVKQQKKASDVKKTIDLSWMK